MRSAVADDLPTFRADRAQIEQVLLNLILNAAEAMPRGGALRLTATHEQFEGAPHVVLGVRDNGQGMTPGQVENLFAPFLTYKESGTGIGLAIVKKIMENHQSQAAGRIPRRPGHALPALLPHRRCGSGLEHFNFSRPCLCRGGLGPSAHERISLLFSRRS